MITPKEVQNIVDQFNVIIARLEQRIAKLEQAAEKPKGKKSD